jgi:hypothetical protein
MFNTFLSSTFPISIMSQINKYALLVIIQYHDIFIQIFFSNKSTDTDYNYFLDFKHYTFTKFISRIKV